MRVRIEHLSPERDAVRVIGGNYKGQTGIKSRSSTAGKSVYVHTDKASSIAQSPRPLGLVDRPVSLTAQPRRPLGLVANKQEGPVQPVHVWIEHLSPECDTVRVRMRLQTNFAHRTCIIAHRTYLISY